MLKLGLKLWSINTDYYLQEAKILFSKGVYDYIELYVVPDSTAQITKWASLDIPYMLHAPHFAHGVNLANSEKLEYNKKIYKEVELFRTELNAQYTVVHGGIEGSVDETIKQLKLINPKNFLIENKPKGALFDENLTCRGYNAEEIEKIIKETSCGFCLDVSHCICSANSQGLNPYEYLAAFNKLNPNLYHLSNGYISSKTDKHLHFKDGDYDITRILNILSKNVPISIETNKDSRENLDDFEGDIKWLKKML